MAPFTGAVETGDAAIAAGGVCEGGDRNGTGTVVAAQQAHPNDPNVSTAAAALLQS